MADPTTTLPPQPNGPPLFGAKAATIVLIALWALGTFGAPWVAPAIRDGFERFEVLTGLDRQQALPDEKK